MSERCKDGASHKWETNEDGFLRESNGHIFCEICGHAHAVPLHGDALARAVQMTGKAEDMVAEGEPVPYVKKRLPGLS